MHLGLPDAVPIMTRMEIKSDNPEHGFQFPGVFEISVMGPADAGLETAVPALLADAGIDVLDESLVTRESSGGKFIQVKLSFKADSREQYQAAHEVLRQHPGVKWTI